MSQSSNGRPGPLLRIGIPLVILGAAGYFGWVKFIQPIIQEKFKEKALSGSTSLSGKKFKKIIKIAGDPWSGYSTFRNEPRLAKELAKSEIGIDYIDDEKYYDQYERMKALASGEIDIALTTVDAFLQHGAKNKKDGIYPGVILWNIDESNGGDAIFLQKGKSSFDEVKRSDKVCYSTGTPSEHLWDFASLSFSALEDLPTDNGVVAKDCWEKLKQGTVQVAVLWQPFTALAEKEGFPKVFATGGQADDVIVDILVANRDFVIKDRETLQRLANAYFKIIGNYEKDSAAHAQFITTDCGADCGGETKLGEAVLSGIDFLNYEENACLWWGQCGTPAKMMERITKTGRLLVAKNKVSASELPNAANILNDSFLVAIKSQMEEKSKLAAEVAGKQTEVRTPKLNVKEKTYSYNAESAKHDTAADVGTLRLPNIYFGDGKSSLDANGRSIVAGIAERLKGFPALCVRVYGHTSSSGNAALNKRLSKARAKAIVQVLHAIDSKAFPDSRFDVRGFGSERLVLKNGVEDAEASRRTEFRLFNCGGR